MSTGECKARLELSTGRFERAAQEYEQAARAEVHGAVAQAEMSAEMWERMCALGNQAKQPWTSHQVTVLNEMSCVADLENQRSLLNEATAELQGHQRQSHEHLQKCQHGVRRCMSEDTLCLLETASGTVETNEEVTV